MISACSTNKLSFDKELNGFIYPYEVKSFEFQSQRQKLTMRYMDVSPTTKPKATIVLLHGKNFSAYYWKSIMKDLLVKGYRVIAPDQIGFGKSTKPEFYQYSFYQLAYNTKLLLDSLGLSKYIVVGHSMGGMLATHFTNQYQKNVSKLILINPIGLERYLDYVQFKDPQFFFENEIKKTVEQYRAYQQKNYYDGKWSDKYEELITPFKGQRDHSDYPIVAWNNALTYGPIFNEDITQGFHNVKVPTILILGTRDRTGPGRAWKKEGVRKKLGLYHKLGKAAVKKFKDAKLIELDDLGHMPQFEDYERFSKFFYTSLEE